MGRDPAGSLGRDNRIVTVLESAFGHLGSTRSNRREQPGRTVWRVTDEERLVFGHAASRRAGSGRVYTVAVDVPGGATCRMMHEHTQTHAARDASRSPRCVPGPAGSEAKNYIHIHIHTESFLSR